jgi:hypothetical protein
MEQKESGLVKLASLIFPLSLAHFTAFPVVRVKSIHEAVSYLGMYGC